MPTPTAGPHTAASSGLGKVAMNYAAQRFEFIDDVVDELGSRKEVYYAREIVKQRRLVLARCGRIRSLAAPRDRVTDDTPRHGLAL